MLKNSIRSSTLPWSGYFRRGEYSQISFETKISKQCTLVRGRFSVAEIFNTIGRNRKFNLHALPIVWIAGSVSVVRILFSNGRQGYKTNAIISNAIIAAIAVITRSPIMSIAHLPL